jgi:hypothetical protein
MDDIGIVEMPPARRPLKPCLHCNEMRFVRVIPREFTTSDRDGKTVVAPMTLTQVPYVTNKLIVGRTVEPVSIKLGDGTLETYTCLACGYVEWWCQNPIQIPIGPEYMSEIVEPVSGAPYR